MQGKNAKGSGGDAVWLMRPGRASLRRAVAGSVLAGLVWPLQAAVVAVTLGGLLAGNAPAPLIAAAGFAVLGLLRAALALWADTHAQTAAELIVTHARAGIIASEAGRGADSPFGGAGSIAALAGEKLDLLVPYVTRYSPARARVMVLPIVIFVLALSQSWAVAAVFLVSGPLIPVFMALVGLAAKETSARQMAEMGTLNDLLVERLSALVDIRLLGAGDTVLAGFATKAGQLRHRTMAVLRIAFLSSTVLELFAAIGVAMVAVYVGFSLLGLLGFGAWGGAISPEAGIFLLLLAPEFYQPLRDLGTAWHDKAAAEAVMAELAAWRAAKTANLPGTGGRAAPLPGPASIMLRDCVTPDGIALPDIQIAPGETVALVGPSGAGKTSALRLMAGLSLPLAGQVVVAGLALTDEVADNWRARLGWMPQAPHFMQASLRQNLTLGRVGDLDGAITSAAIKGVIAGLPQGLNTRLGETGTGLSGGEARRVTLARALYAAPDVILADEPTANLDAATAALVTKALLAAAARGATLVVATHDPALAARMGRVIRFGVRE
ncbi:ABC transporter ATP-binding protein/permease [Phaeovulum sp.]|uniref:ABC transporter ATP-binding protein/permease n=1 Tax=Phaeovulum sp. TaxID=2934796 RepID=UPI0039E6760B